MKYITDVKFFVSSVGVMQPGSMHLVVSGLVDGVGFVVGVGFGVSVVNTVVSFDGIVSTVIGVVSVTRSVPKCNIYYRFLFT